MPFGHILQRRPGVTEISDQAHNKLLQELTTKRRSALAEAQSWCIHVGVVRRGISLRNPRRWVLLGVFIGGRPRRLDRIREVWPFPWPTMLNVLLAFATTPGRP